MTREIIATRKARDVAFDKRKEEKERIRREKTIVQYIGGKKRFISEKIVKKGKLLSEKKKRRDKRPNEPAKQRVSMHQDKLGTEGNAELNLSQK